MLSSKVHPSLNYVVVRCMVGRAQPFLKLLYKNVNKNGAVGVLIAISIDINQLATIYTF